MQAAPRLFQLMRVQNIRYKWLIFLIQKNLYLKVIPPHGSSKNPVDIVGDADFNRFEKVLEEILSNPNVGSVVTMCTPSATLDYNELSQNYY